MKLNEFIKMFICKNSLIRLWYETNNGYKMVSDDYNPYEESEILNKRCKLSEFLNNDVIRIENILTDYYPESINIVILETPINIIRKEKISKLL